MSFQRNLYYIHNLFDFSTDNANSIVKNLIQPKTCRYGNLSETNSHFDRKRSYKENFFLLKNNL